MRLVVQRVSRASVAVDGEIKGEIGRGFMVLFGAGQGDTRQYCEKLADKLSKLRIFSDENGKTNLSVDDAGGDMLIISQFTLYADCRKGNRPSFIYACAPDEANELYEYFCECVKERISGRVEKGVFGADMQVELINDGPFTVILDSSEIIKD